MKTYTVRAKRWERGWELRIQGVGVTQSRTLSGADRMVRDYIALDRDEAPDTFDVEIIPEVGGELDTQIAQAHIDGADAAAKVKAAAARYRRIARELADTGMTGRDVARVLRVSPGRVSQLLNERDAS